MIMDQGADLPLIMDGHLGHTEGPRRRQGEATPGRGEARRGAVVGPQRSRSS